MSYVRIGYWLKCVLKELSPRLGIDTASMFDVPSGLLRQLLAHRAAVAEVVAAAVSYRFDRAAWSTSTSPYTISSGMRISGNAVYTPPLERSYSAGGSETLYGVGCSGGVVRGRACVVATLADAMTSIQRGDILVTNCTSPAWTPLFTLIGGLVVQAGGVLCHGAVVARECGVPCVCLEGACGAVSSGQLIQIDGQAGTLRIVSASTVVT